MSKARTHLWTILKWVLAVALLAVFFKSGKISWSDFRVFAEHPQYAVGAVGLSACALALLFYRWKLLLRGVGVEVAYVKVVQLGMLGQFFSAIIPGSVGGDLVKAVYVARRYPTAKLKVISSVVVDRIVGLGAMFVVSAAAFLVAKSSGVDLGALGSSGWLLVGGALGFLLFVAGLKLWVRWLPRRTAASRLQPLFDVVRDYHDSARELWLAIVVSCVIHTFTMSVLWLIATAMFGPAPWGRVGLPQLIVGSLIGISAQAIPLTPMGLGVGQAAFAGLFATLGAHDPAFGATIITAQQALTLMWNLSGSMFFAGYKNEIAAARATETP